MSDERPGSETGSEGAPLSPERRRVIGLAGLALGGVAAVVVGIPIVGFLIWPVRRKVHDIWHPVGRVDEFEVGATVLVTYFDPAELPWAGFASESAAYLRRESDTDFVAFSIYCTHTGCPVRWLEGAQLFFCPCHGGAFTREGAVSAGPPPRSLERHDVRVRDGQVEIRTARIPLDERGTGR
jgi:menaquinol-cytochrome c reductase iron-sulfur subunit